MAARPPLVSVICLCYNQASYLADALNSVLAQTYAGWELIIVDDASTDGSPALIRQWASRQAGVKTLMLPENIGNCRAFNRGLALATGEYIVDLAADDVLLPNRLAEGVHTLESLPPDWGLEFSDAWLISADGNPLSTHHKRNGRGELIETVPEGDVYAQVLQRYFICAPTIFVRKKVYDALGGYNPLLAYEDFDFWVRASRQYKFAFNPKILVKKRIVSSSWSAQQYKPTNRQLWSTLQVCRTAAALNQNRQENRALGQRLLYELRQAIRYGQPAVAYQLWQLKRSVWPQPLDWLYRPLLKKAAR